MIGKNSVLLAFALILLCSSVNADLLATVSPKDPGFETLSLYLDETGEYELTIFNDGTEPAGKVVVKVSSVEGLQIIDLGAGKNVLGMNIEEILPGEKKTVLLKLKPVEQSAKKLFLYVDYGIRDYTHLVATYLEVRESPLEISTVLSKTALDMGEEASIKLSMKNHGTSPVRNIKAELIAFQGIESMNGTVSLDSLAPGEGYDAKEFVFRADPAASGKRQLAMQISFEDDLGKHILERNFSVEIQSKQEIMYIIAAIIVLLVVVALLSRKREHKDVKKLEKPIVKELPDKDVKPVKS